MDVGSDCVDEVPGLTPAGRSPVIDICSRRAGPTTKPPPLERRTAVKWHARHISCEHGLSHRLGLVMLKMSVVQIPCGGA